jgi:DNA-binding CsgD family transcriptional regulator
MPRKKEDVREMRLKTLTLILQGKDIDTIAMEFGVTTKAIKLRLTGIYKYYKVKNRIELMALYINIPLEIRKSMRKNNAPVMRQSTYKTKEQFGALPIGNENDIQQPK